MRSPRPVQACLALFLATALFACGKSDDGRQDANAPLAFVPIDTPYVFANLEPVPRSVTESWLGMLQPLHVGYRESLQRARAAANGTEDRKRQRAVALMELFEDKFTIEGWERIGISPQNHLALYGIGVQPVMRLSLLDAERLRAFVRELEARIDEAAPVAQIEGLDYWRFPIGPDQTSAVVAAIVGDHLVVTIDFEHGEPLPRLLGLQRPAESMIEAAELVEINRRYGFTPLGTSVIDMSRLAAAFVGANDGDASIISRISGEAVPAECRNELMAMAQQAPRLVMGYTALDARRQEAVAVLELDTALAQPLGTLAAPVPGLGSSRGGIEFGFSLKLDKLAEFVQARASAIRAAPYVCEWFQPMNDSAEQAGQQLAALYMGASWFSGARIVIDDFAVGADGTPERVDAMAMLVAPNPASLVAMAKSFVPQLGGLDLVAGAPPKRLDGESLGVPGDFDQAVWAAMTDTAIALATGAGAEAGLPGHLAAAAPDPAPLLHMSYSGALYGKLMRSFEASNDNDDAITMDGDPGPVRDDPEYVFEPLLKSVDRIYDALEYVGFDIRVSARGIEMRSVSTLSVAR